MPPNDASAAFGAFFDDQRWIRTAIELSRRCPPSSTAFSVGAVIVDTDGRVIATGYSRQHDPRDHAEEVALAAVRRHSESIDLTRTTLYSSLEPCGDRASRPDSCASLIIAAGIPRVVFAWREPAIFVQGRGASLLRAAGVDVVELSELADLVRDVNAHLLS